MNKLLLSILLMGTIFLFTSCDDNPSDPGPGNSNYFPNGDGAYYKYNMVSTDSSGSQEQGTRTSRYNGTQALAGTNYQVQLDSITIQNQTTGALSYFRKTDTGIFYFADTTGLAASIPDSLEQYLSTDAEVRTLLLPLAAGSSWPVYKINLNYGPIVFSPVEVSAAYAGTEDVVLNLTSGQQTKTAVRIKYTLKLTFTFGQPSRFYEAHAWVADGIGIIKWEGNATLLNGISGSGIDFADTTRIVSQSLIEYDVN